VEEDRSAADALNLNKIKLAAEPCKIIRGDALKFIAASAEIFDVIFVDPPFSSELMPPLLPVLLKKLTAQGVIYAEWGAPLADLLSRQPETALSIAKQGKAGAVHFALLSAQIPIDI